MKTEDLEDAAKREIAKMRHVMESLRVTDGKENDRDAVELEKLAEAYYGDAVHFLHTGKFLEAFEAVVISWTYVDSGLHLGVFMVDEGVKKLFTVA